MSVVDEILRRPEFAAAPPILVDVGAAGAVHRDWAPVAPYAVCVAFDADVREMGYVEKEAAGYRRLVVYSAILHDRPAATAEFHLTRSPYCSSALRPRNDRLAAWAFADLFEVVETKSLRAVSLPDVLAEQKLERVDWFKTDSQGTDLRLFRSLGEERVRRVLAAQFEPGIIEAYEGEDTLADVLAFMSAQGFWMSDLEIHGSQRIGAAARRALPTKLRERIRRGVRTSPGWGEATYLNAFEGEWSVRDLLLGWVIATLRRQHGFALELALKGAAAGSDPAFDMLRRRSLAAMGRSAAAFPAFAALRRLGALASRGS